MTIRFAPALRVAALAAVSWLGTASAFAGINVSIEAPTVQTTSVSGAITEDFNSADLGGLTSYTSVIGAYSASGTIVQVADVYGGADDTQYVAIGSQAHSAGALTLALNGPANYFGLWWSAIDNQNEITLLSGASVVGTYTSNDILNLVNATANPGLYYGNPNPAHAGNTGEAYAYVNFTAFGGTSFDTIVFRNSINTGFESDNHSVRAVPEPSTLLMGGVASVLGLIGLRRRNRSV